MYKQDFVTQQLVWKSIMAQYATYTSVLWKLETSLNGLFSEIGNTLDIHRFWITFNEGEGIYLILRIFKELLELFMWKKYIRHKLLF